MAFRRAKEKSKIISFDPNYRPPLRPDEATARQTIRLSIPEVDILKLSELERELLTRECDLERGARSSLENVVGS